MSRIVRALAPSALIGKTACLLCFMTAAPLALAMPAATSRSLAQLPMAFEENRGQLDRSVQFVAKGQGYNVFLTRQAAVLVLARQAGADSLAASVLRMRFDGASARAASQGLERLPLKTHYFSGSGRASQQVDVPSHARVKYSGIYPGVDLVYYGNQEQLEYDLHVAPGADPAAIKLRVDGAAGISVSPEGELVLRTEHGDVRYKKPVAYQQRSGKRVEVPARYVLAANGQVAFDLGPYDRRQALVIDPILSYASFMYGNAATGVAFDGTGNMYVAGYTLVADLPATTAYQTVFSGYVAGYVLKLNPSGSQVLYASYLGVRSSNTWARALAVDSAGNAIVAGMTDSASYPVTSGAYQTRASSADTQRAWITKLNASGSALVYSTLVNGVDEIAALALDASGNAYLAGRGARLVTTAGALQTALPQANGAPFVAKLNASGSAMAYATYCAGGAFDLVHGLAVDKAGSAYLTGYTTSPDRPLKNPWQATLRGGSDAYVTKLNPTGTALDYSTYFGGSSSSSIESGQAIAVDALGNAYIAGVTDSDDLPVTADVFQPAKGSPGAQSRNGFVAKFGPTGTQLLYATYLGGAGTYRAGSFGSQIPDQDLPTAIGVDGGGHAYIAGLTDTFSFPSVDPILLAGYYREKTPFVAKISPSAERIIYAVAVGPNKAVCIDCLNSSRSQSLEALAIDTKGSVAVVGSLVDGNNADPSLKVGQSIKADSMLFFPTVGAQLTAGNAWMVRLSTGKYPTTVRASANPATAGAPVLLTADVQSVQPGGSVTFTDGATTLGTVPMSLGRASLSVTLPEGGHRITAVYSADGKVSPVLYLIAAAP